MLLPGSPVLTAMLLPGSPGEKNPGSAESPGTNSYLPTRSLRAPYALNTRCPVLSSRVVRRVPISLRAPYAMPGTDVAYDAQYGLVLKQRLWHLIWAGHPTFQSHRSSLDIRQRLSGEREREREREKEGGELVLSAYANHVMPCPRTANAHSAICLRACYALSGTDLAYVSTGEESGPLGKPPLPPNTTPRAGTSLPPPYAMPGTDIAYGAVRVLRDVRY
eukprot:3108679-Rhodomonas_salina.4